MIIRKLRLQDINSASGIVAENYSPKYERLAELDIKAMFGKSHMRPTYYVAELNGDIVGFAGFIQSWMDYNIYEIFWVNVSHKEQNKGIGKALVSRVILEIQKKKNARMILLSSKIKNQDYYVKNFGFKTSEFFGKKSNEQLMSLKI